MLKKVGKCLKVYEVKDVLDDCAADDLREKIYSEFREGNENLKIGESGELMFEVVVDAYQTRASKRDAKKKRVLFVATEDKTEFNQILEDLESILDADARTSVFMTDDKYGIRANQTAGSVFMKYGNSLTLMTGVHLSKVSWHRWS